MILTCQKLVCFSFFRERWEYFFEVWGGRGITGLDISLIPTLLRPPMHASPFRKLATQCTDFKTVNFQRMSRSLGHFLSTVPKSCPLVRGICIFFNRCDGLKTCRPLPRAGKGGAQTKKGGMSRTPEAFCRKIAVSPEAFAIPRSALQRVPRIKLGSIRHFWLCFVSEFLGLLKTLTASGFG